MKKIKIRDKTFKLFLKERQLTKRIKSIANELNHQLVRKSEPTIFLIVTNGSIPFAAELMKHINPKLECEFHAISLQSYCGGLESNEDVKIGGKSNIPSLVDRDVVVIEDIIDTGNSMFTLSEWLMESGANSVSAATLFYKVQAEGINLFYIDKVHFGFILEDEFVVGYGMDYMHQGRNLKDIYILDK